MSGIYRPNPLTFRVFRANLKNRLDKETQGKREYICRSFTEKSPRFVMPKMLKDLTDRAVCGGLLRGDKGKQVEDGFGVAGMNLI